MSDPIALIDVKAHRHLIGSQIDENIAAVVEHGQWILGPEVKQFEAAASAFVGNSVHSIGCSNGTDALVMAMQALGLPQGHAVICPAFTFVATAEAVAALGGAPVFCDVGTVGFNMSAEAARHAAKMAEAAGLTIAGFCSVDLFGMPADYDELRTVANEYDAWLLADAAQSFGATAKGVTVGAMADATTTSFFPAKPLGGYGDGGMVFTADSDTAEIIRSLRVHGKGSHKYDNVRIGQNSRLDTLQAAILLPKLQILPAELDARERIAARYSSGLAGLVGVPSIPVGFRSAWAQYTIVTEARTAIIEHLSGREIGSAIYYPKPLHRQDAYAHFHLEGIDLARTDWLSERVMSLPMHPYLSDEQVDRVISEVSAAVSAT